MLLGIAYTDLGKPFSIDQELRNAGQFRSL